MKWSFILLLPAVVSLFWPIAIALFKKHPTRAQILLSLLLILMAFNIAVMAVFFRGRAGSLFIYNYIYELVSVLCGPVYYVAICSLTEPRGATLRQRRIFFIPLVFILIHTFLSFHLGPRQYEIMCQQIRDGALGSHPTNITWNFLLFWSHYFFSALLIVMNFVLVLMASRKSRLFERRFNSYYAQNINARKNNSRPLRLLSWAFLPMAVLVVLTVDYRPYYYKYILIVLSVFLSVIQFYIGRYTYTLDYDARYLADLVRRDVNFPQAEHS